MRMRQRKKEEEVKGAKQFFDREKMFSQIRSKKNKKYLQILEPS